jgi:hypothetical protein
MTLPITVQGRHVDSATLEWIQGWIREHFDWSRRRLAKELCLAWDWRDGAGRLKDFAARSFLLKLQERDLIKLPALRKARTPNHPKLRLTESCPSVEPLSAKFAELEGVNLEVVVPGTQSARRWAYYLTHYHYLGLRVVGQNLGYLAKDNSGRELAALLFGAPAWRCAPRDSYLQAQGFCPRQSLDQIANNTRFLIFPWVKVPHLASHVLGLAARRIVADWHQKYGVALQWLETFVERERFAGTCYRAANWTPAGTTKGRGRQDRHHSTKVAEKDVFLYALKR